MFNLKLALSTGWTIEYVDSLPIKTIRELQALNKMNPFLYQHQVERECLIATLLYNQKVTKKANLKSVHDLFPYMKGGIPDEFEDEVVLKARRIHESLQFTLSGREHPGLEEFRTKLKEQIDIEQSGQVYDKYRVKKLTEMLDSI